MYMPIYQISNNYYNRSHNKIYCVFHCSIALYVRFSATHPLPRTRTRTHIYTLTSNAFISASGFNFIFRIYICIRRAALCEVHLCALCVVIGATHCTATDMKHSAHIHTYIYSPNYKFSQRRTGGRRNFHQFTFH